MELRAARVKSSKPARVSETLPFKKEVSLQIITNQTPFSPSLVGILYRSNSTLFQTGNFQLDSIKTTKVLEINIHVTWMFIFYFVLILYTVFLLLKFKLEQ